MCGIYGMVALGLEPLAHPDRLERMAAAVRHRGPDSRGRLVQPGAALGVERLRIVDRRREADQPFTDGACHHTLVCNGEIYNAPALRRRYGNYPYRSHSDVEPVLPLLEDRGLAGLNDLCGMFAIALWNHRTRTLHLIRDAAGEKPLFYARRDDEVWFASEIHALFAHPSVARVADADALRDYLALGCVREPRTPFRDVRKVPAGTVLEFAPGRDPTARSLAGSAHSPGGPVSSPDRIRVALSEAVGRQLRSEVPVGVFASGGLDSSFVAALAAGHVGPQNLVAFSVRFADTSYDESPYARRLATELGMGFAAVTADTEALRSAHRDLIDRCAEPLADPAILPTILLAREARQRVGVVLVGEGADELFGGYPTYPGHRWANWVGHLHPSIRRSLRAMLRGPAAGGGKVSVPFLLDRWLAEVARPPRERHVTWFGTGLFPYLSAPAQSEVLAALPEFAHPDPVSSAMTFDFETFLRDSLLVKLDRATMAVSLEARAPFLDPAVVAVARGLDRGPVAPWAPKPALNAAARGVVPDWVRRRRKRGLSVPVARWINEGLREDVDRVLSPERWWGEGVLSGTRIAHLLSEHRTGRANHGRGLWALYTLQAWMERWVS